jgi:hypothetical protein
VLERVSMGGRSEPRRRHFAFYRSSIKNVVPI